MLLAIETSCDETAVALLDLSKPISETSSSSEFLKSEIIASQIKLHQAYGGVVPELASREHLINLPLLIKKTIDDNSLNTDQIKAVAVTRGPGLKGCLLVGLTFAKFFAFSKNVPLLCINHLEGHVFSGNMLAREERPEYPYLTLLVSGGHTELILVEAYRKYKIICRTKDDAVGEAFDKSATLIGLPYPGGPQLAKRAETGDEESFRFPYGMPEDDSAFSFSGIKTAISREVKSLGDKVND
ncbi:MAG: tRNA (adenosine(37)-N6)-threonylcarbamoyltransferase complex transferase subunit TsaD, partial [Proteobacteria bacterium]|nr:tRNA (adenosine(37)-N6)-threonylcarbamoyltransferase complex transferase subunit TsaD [Pseudomonadota bacterium]